MNPAKRLFDLALALCLMPLALPIGAVLALGLRGAQGAPVFYGAERIGQGGRPFTLWKFRTMQVGTEDQGVSGGNKAARITRVGRVLRRLRLDELPQLWNILRGDLSFVGPRPPLRRYVERFPALYSIVLQRRPGLTGLATLIYHRHEERLLARCQTAAETDALYGRACVPRKARLDRIYADHAGLCFDLRILLGTVRKVLGR